MRVRVNGSELEVDSHGPIGAPAVVLIADADTAAVRWSPTLLRLLGGAGFRVVTFDHRGTGRSAPSTSPFLLTDMADDVAAVLGSLDLAEAGVVGCGMGGTVALHLALQHPTLVRSLLVIGATPGRSDERLPDPTPELVEAMVARAWAGKPTTREDRIVWVMELAGFLAGGRYPVDEADEIRRVVQHIDQELEIESGGEDESGHGHAVVETESVLDRLAEVVQPTMVLHGDEDPVYPLGHGEAIARQVPLGQLEVVAGLGHHLPEEFVVEYGEVIVDALRREL